MTAVAVAPSWEPVCDYADLTPERGVAALIDGEQIALFRLADGTLRAVGHRDPVTGAYVLARGIVGSRGPSPTITSPMLKHTFDLDTGRSVDDPTVGLPTYPVRIADGIVHVAARPARREWRGLL
jgi:nitrite reductase (NADH) small subunit